MSTYLSKSNSMEALLESNPDLNQDVHNYNINVTANYGLELNAEEVFNKMRNHNGAFQPTHLYFHVPLCAYICHFCNYVKKLHNKDKGELDKWATLLIKESNYYLSNIPWIKDADIQSVYFGGGTATLLGSTRLKKVLDHVRANYNLSENCEISLEGNPDDFLKEEALESVGIGFNRFSLGVQSLQSEVNEFAGRKHDAEMSLKAIANLKKTKFPFNVDMMFGLPHQTVNTVQQDIQKLTSLKVPTITIYRLRNADRESMDIGNRAVWNIPRIKNKLDAENRIPSIQDTYKMRDAAVNVLLESGYRPSPCGWWNAPDTYPNGNIPQVSKNKWENYNSMLAYGPGAYGWISGGSKEVIQTHNQKDISAYARYMEKEILLPPLSKGRHLIGNQAIASALGFAYKSGQPIRLDRFKNHYGVDLLNDAPYKEVFESLLRKNFIRLEEDGNAFKPTLEGEALHEEIISVYFHNKLGNFKDVVCHITEDND